MSEKREWRFPSTTEGMVLGEIVEYASVEYGQEISLETLKGHHKQRRNDFPEPAAVYAGRPVWNRADIDDWLSTRKRTTGPRPSRRPASVPDLETLKRDSPAVYEQLLDAARAEVEKQA